MKNATSYSLNLAVAALLVLASATIAAAVGAGNDTCVGGGADIGSTCTPLTNTTSGNNANTAIGANTLGSNTTGIDNTAIGAGAMFFNTMGQDNTATGLSALIMNITGNENTATGVFALEENTSGADNTATGVRAMMFSTGNDNTATGVDALENNTGGGSNTAIGGVALGANTTGSNNIAVGFDAGDNLTTGSNNIDIFDAGVAGESNTIRIGSEGAQTATFIAGIFGGPKIKKGCDVIAGSNGMLGCIKSSVRYKRDIRDMGDASDKLMKLRPVTFQYKEDSDGIQQYGLIAEEVEKVYPELVIEGNDGRPETVEYQVLPAMLLNELQKEVRDNDRQTAQIAKLSRQIEEMKARHDKELGAMRAAFEDRVSRIEREMAARDGGRNIAATFSR
jgi:Chaperone of endosialidase